jgi:hypothetical protein
MPDRPRSIATAIGQERRRMRARTFILAMAILALAVPAATAAGEKRVAVEAIVTLRLLGSENWQLDIQNSTPASVTIRHVTWSAPAGLTVMRIQHSVQGHCVQTGNGFRCTTWLEPPTCSNCLGDDLRVEFKGSGLERRWVKTSYGGYWQQRPLASGHASLVAVPTPSDAT